MYAPLTVEVKSLGEDVQLVIGSWRRRMHFETAVLLAAWLDECARDAKAWIGNSQRMLRGVGTLHDASNPNWINAGQPNTAGWRYPVNHDRLKKAQIAVRQDCGIVVLTAGTAQASIPFDAALQISQWIRVRAKESQARAGDVTRHWSKIKQAHEVANGPGVTQG